MERQATGPCSTLRSGSSNNAATEQTTESTEDEYKCSEMMMLIAISRGWVQKTAVLNPTQKSII